MQLAMNSGADERFFLYVNNAVRPDQRDPVVSPRLWGQ